MDAGPVRTRSRYLWGRFWTSHLPLLRSKIEDSQSPGSNALDHRGCPRRNLFAKVPSSPLLIYSLHHIQLACMQHALPVGRQNDEKQRWLLSARIASLPGDHSLTAPATLPPEPTSLLAQDIFAGRTLPNASPSNARI